MKGGLIFLNNKYGDGQILKNKKKNTIILPGLICVTPPIHYTCHNKPPHLLYT